MDRRIYNSGPIKHGFGSKSNLEKHKFYDLYCGMVARCTRKTHSSYKNYGGRGIKVLWKSFEEFKNDMYDTYIDLSIFTYTVKILYIYPYRNERSYT